MDILNQNYLILTILIILIYSSISSSFLTPYVISFGERFKILDYPSLRKNHKKPIVSIGGISLLLPYISIIIFILLLNNLEIISINNVNKIITLGCISILYFLIGLIDDIYRLSPWPRLFFQSIFSFLIWNNGINIKHLDFSIFNQSYPILNIPDSISIIFNIIWIVGITNAINWVDGIDGLAASVSCLISLGLIPISIANNNILIALISASLCGCCIGFLFHNSYPAKIHMGDSGSFFLGFNLASLSLLGIEKLQFNNIETHSPLILLAILAVPSLDMAAVIFQRILDSKSPFFADRRHLHHKFLNMGFSCNKTLIIICILNFWSISIALYLTPVSFSKVILAFSTILLTLLGLSLFNSNKLKNQKDNIYR